MKAKEARAEIRWINREIRHINRIIRRSKDYLEPEEISQGYAELNWLYDKRAELRAELRARRAKKGGASD